jgi:hypothetical protein
MGTQRIKVKGVFPWMARWARFAGTRDFCPALVAVVGPGQNMFFLAVHYLFSFAYIAQQAWGRQSCWVACL